MIDLHTHSIFSDGVLLPSELVRRAKTKGLEAIAITDHVDISNIDFVIPRISKVCEDLKNKFDINVIAGAEITHAPPESIKHLTKYARKLGANLVIVHGETIVEPVTPGTNRAAIDANIDILAHPGLITKEDALKAKNNNIYLEISGRKGHSLTNGHVANIAKDTGANLVFNSDSHTPEDLLDENISKKIIAGAGLDESYFDIMMNNSKKIVNRK